MMAESSVPTIAIIGGGPAGLMAAEVVSQHGLRVDVYDAMPSLGRKFLMAGKSGLNLTHAEPLSEFMSRYGARRSELEPIIEALPPQALRDWAKGLGVETFVGSSKRVFPNEMKAAPLLRAWLHRLRVAGMRVHVQYRWLGFDMHNRLRFLTPAGEISVATEATVLALGGGSWARLGSNGAWVPILQQAGIMVQPLQPSNCGFDVNWSRHLRTRFAGEPVKSVMLTFTDNTGVTRQQQGDFVLTEYGVEGSLVYVFAAALREVIHSYGCATIYLDLLPALSIEQIQEKLAQSRGKRSLSEQFRRQLHLTGVKAAMLHELVPEKIKHEPTKLAAWIKALPIVCDRPRPIDEAISTAGGIAFEALDNHLMIKKLPGIFCAGEMLDWDAPTGGYLLTACLASGYVAGQGVLQWIAQGAARQY